MAAQITPIFRRDVLRPRVRAFTLSDDEVASREKLREWANLFSTEKGLSYKETEVLPDWMTDVFQTLLGYTGPVAQAADGRHTFSREKLVEVGGKFADGVIAEFAPARTTYVAAIEGKGPKDPLDRPFAGRAMSAVDQAYRYAINLPCDWIIVTSMREIRLYYKGATQRTYERWTISDLATDDDAFKRFVFLLGAERVAPASGECHLYELLHASQRAGEELTQAYYSEYARIRHEVLSGLVRANSSVAPGDVLSATQRLLDRTIFIAFAEDRGLLPEETLAKAYQHRDPYNPRPIWGTFQALFRAIDQGSDALSIPKYNGGLFKPDAILDEQLSVPDAVCEHLKRLGDYNYSTADDGAESPLIDVEILGHIFEQSIEDLEAIRADLEGGEEVTRATSKRKRTGAFYTPAFVTRYIVSQTLQPTLGDRFERLRAAHQKSARRTTASGTLADPRTYDLDALNTPQRDALVLFWEGWIDELKRVRVIDPACGSGAFLIEVFDQLHAEYQQALGRLGELRRGGFAGDLFDPDRTILQENIYGVDLNEEAIEIARLSIWIKTAQRGKVLTDLDASIRVANSVVSDPEIDPRAARWSTIFQKVFAAGGFDAVVGNPPYVRAELLTEIKPHLEKNFASYHGSADLFVYFYELGLRILRPGGRLSYIVTNKWLKTGYGEPLRRFFAERGWVEEVVDLGHAKEIFPDADVFPCIIRVQKPSEGPVPEEVSVTVIPRDEFRATDLAGQIAERAFTMPRTALTSAPWTLEPPALTALMEKLRRVGVPLAEYLGTRSYRGVVTGANQVFIIDSSTRASLLAEDPASAEIIKPCLRGQEVDRWSVQWGGDWMIFARRGIDIARYPAVHRYLAEHREALEPRPEDWRGDRWPGRKPGNYRWHEIQDTVEYFPVFEQPKIVHTDLAWRPEFALVTEPMYPVNTVYVWPTDDLYVLGVLNSPLIWSYMWRNAQHGKDETLRLFAAFTETIPIAPAGDEIRDAVSERVGQLIEMSRERRNAIYSMLAWLQIELGIEQLGNKLIVPDTLEFEAFATEVRKRKGGAKSLTSAELKRLRTEYDQLVPALRDRQQRANTAEMEIARMVNSAYGLTAEEVDLLWRTAPPRTPLVGMAEGVRDEKIVDAE